MCGLYIHVHIFKYKDRGNVNMELYTLYSMRVEPENEITNVCHYSGIEVGHQSGFRFHLLVCVLCAALPHNSKVGYIHYNRCSLEIVLYKTLCARDVCVRTHVCKFYCKGNTVCAYMYIVCWYLLSNRSV